MVSFDGETRGFAYVEYQLPGAALAAWRWFETQGPTGADGRIVRLGWAEKRSVDTLHAKILFVSKLPTGVVDEGAVTRAFDKYGPLIEVHLARHRDSGNCRGFGFIEYK